MVRLAAFVKRQQIVEPETIARAISVVLASPPTWKSIRTVGEVNKRLLIRDFKVLFSRLEIYRVIN